MKNTYRYYVYDFLIGQYLLTIDTVGRRHRIDSFNIYGECNTFDRDWEKITEENIQRAMTRDEYVIDSYILKHFTNFNSGQTIKEPLLITNEYDDCIRFIAKYAKNNHNYSCTEVSDIYYKKYLSQEKQEELEME